VALYAAETWTFSKADRNGIEAFEVWIWRRICQRSVGRQ